MYYIRLSADDSNKLVYYCRNCGNEESELKVDENICISKTQIKQDSQNFSHIINEYTKLDPTLPRISNILCPNVNCPTNTEDIPKEIIVIRYDDINMKYVYLCSTCNHYWKINENK
jgi:DNA-directed RNA polymerase subunit M/transcription elongation factor TFIIS